MSRLQALLSRMRESGNARDIASRAFFALFATLFVFQLLIPLIETWREEPSATIRVIVTVLVIIFVATYGYTIFRLYFLRRSWVQLFTQRDRWLLRGLTAGPATILVLWQGSEWALSLIFFVLVTIVTGPPLRAFYTQTQAMVFVVIVLIGARVDTETLLSTLAFSFVFGALISTQFRQGGVIGEMMEARYTEARMAAAEERLRISRDLHDVLGHTLSLITLKSELASALPEKDPLRAQREMREVESLARSAMTDVRRTVADERQPILSSELVDARHLLDAAGITLKVEVNGSDLSDDVAALFAWSVREGVTNVVRHSRARHCTISLKRDGGRALLSVVDDGAGPDAPGTRLGSGLAGLSDRAERMSGTLAFETLPDDTGHALTVSVPVPRGE